MVGQWGRAIRENASPCSYGRTIIDAKAWNQQGNIAVAGPNGEPADHRRLAAAAANGTVGGGKHFFRGAMRISRP